MEKVRHCSTALEFHRKPKLLLFSLILFTLVISCFQSNFIQTVNASPSALPPETLYAGNDTGLYSDDQVSAYFDIGFNFTFYGNTYSTCAATTNGLLGFGGGPTSTYTNTYVPNASSPNNSIYAFWDDLYPRERNESNELIALVLYRTIGVAPNRELIVQWTNYGYYSYPTLPMGTFQAILYEGTNDIRMQYRQLLTEGLSNGSSATIGVENANGSAAVQFSYNTESIDSEQSILWTWNGSTYVYDAGASYEGVLLYDDNPPPGVPTLISPANGSAGISESPTFSWNTAADTDTYNLVVSVNSNLSSPIITQTGLTSTSYSASGLSDNTEYYWGVEAVNSYGNSWSSIWNFSTAEGNSAPNDISLSNNTINAGQASGTTVGTLSTTDPDDGDTHTYSLVEGAGSSDNASFSISGSTLQTASSLTGGDYTIRIRTTDQGGLYYEEAFSITVTSTNSAPTSINSSNNNFAENIAANSSVTTLSTTDPDAGDTFTYSLVSGEGDTDNNAFTVSGSSLLINASPDYEAQSSYTFRVRSTDQGGLFTESQFTLAVINETENTTTTITSISPEPSVYGQDYTVSVSVAPASGAGTVTGNVSIGDGEHSCSAVLSSGSGSCVLPSEDVANFQISATYTGNTDWYTSTSTSIQHEITACQTTTTITSDSPDPSELYSNYPVSVSVSPVAPCTATPTGQVEIAGGGFSCTASLTGGTGACSLASMSVSMFTITAGYSFDRDAFSSSSDTETHTVVDTIPPTVTIDQSSSQIDPTNSSPIGFTVEFSEPVGCDSEFDGGDVDLSGSTAPGTLIANATKINDYEYYISVSGMTGSGDVIATVVANGFQDGACNYNLASTSTDNTITYDVTPPSVTVEQGASQPDPTNTEPHVFEVEFSESVTGIGSDDLTISGMTNTPTVSISGSGTSYIIEVSGVVDGETVTVDVNAGAAVDHAGNASLASTSTDNSVTFDTTQPTVTIEQGASQADPTNASPIVFDVKFSETVTGFEVDDVSILGMANTPAITLNGSGTTYSVEVSGMLTGETITAEVMVDAALDSAGNSSQASTSTDNSVTYDTTPPTVTIEQGSSQLDPTNISPITFDVTFSDPVTGFSGAGVEITGVSGSPTVLVSGSGSIYTVEVSGMADGETVAASVLDGAAEDSAGNPSEASTSIDNSVTFDITSPSVTINQGALQADPTNAEPILFAVEFSESVLGFDSNDVSITGMAGLPAIVVNGSGENYTVEVTGIADGETVTATIAANVALDHAGNPSLESTSTDNNVLYDITSIQAYLNTGVIGNPGNLVILENGQYLTRFTEISIEFDSDAYDPAGNTEPDDVTNIANYYLLRPGENYVFNVSTCSQIALLGTSSEWDDVLVPITSAVYDNNDGDGPFLVSLTMNRLQLDKYRLILCGSTSIVDLAMNPLNDGVDVTVDFSIVDLPDELPNTGFPMGVTLNIPEQESESAYSNTGMFLTLPTLGVSTQIIGVPLEDDGWNTVWLGNYAGFLEGSAFPTWAGNTVITGHVWTSTNEPGIFVDLDELKYGDEFQIYAWGQVYTYSVRSNRLLSDTNVASVMRNNTLDWVTLLTCEIYDAETGTFIYRRVVRAVLVSVE